MKKILMIAIATMMIGSAFAAAPKNFYWNCQSEEQINKWIEESKTANDALYENVTNIQKLLLGKDDKNITYKELKKIIEDNAKEKDYKTFAVPQVIRSITRFRGFVKDVINDSDYGIKNDYVATWLITIKNALSPEDYRANLTNYLPKMKISLFNAKEYINTYEFYSISYTDEEIKSDLKKIKRTIYPNLSINEDWKKLIIKIELIIKPDVPILK